MAKFENIHGLLTIFEEKPDWPSPTNIFIIPDDGGFSMIEVGCGSAAGIEHLNEGIKHFGLDLKDLHTVVLSHAHPDHMGAMWWILENVNPKVFIHQIEVESALNPDLLEETFDLAMAKKYWADFENNNFDGLRLLTYFEQFGCAMSRAKEVSGLDEGELLKLGDFEFEVIHTPAHSPGHISLFEKSKGILIAGDLVGRYPAWYTPNSGGFTAYLESLDKLEAVSANVLVPAHGDVYENPREIISKIRGKILNRESKITDSLKSGPKNAMEWNKMLFPNPLVHFFPGVGVIESHLLKLEQQGSIVREGYQVSLAGGG